MTVPRRGFLKKGILGGALLLIGGGAGLGLAALAPDLVAQRVPGAGAAGARHLLLLAPGLLLAGLPGPPGGAVVTGKVLAAADVTGPLTPDFCVVGSGAGGSMAAAVLAQA